MKNIYRIIGEFTCGLHELEFNEDSWNKITSYYRNVMNNESSLISKADMGAAYAISSEIDYVLGALHEDNNFKDRVFDAKDDFFEIVADKMPDEVYDTWKEN